MRRKPGWLCLIFFLISITVNAQRNISFDKAFQVKLDPLSLLYDYSRLGIGLEKKFTHSSIWAAYYYGKNLNYAENRDYPGDYFKYFGVQTGVKKLFARAKGEYYIGGSAGYDYSRKYVSQDVYYDLDRNFEVSFQSAYYARNRLSLFIENGYEYYLNHRLSLEISAGLGLRSIQNRYEFVHEPIFKHETEPRVYDRKNQYKYIGTFIKPVGTCSLKLGWRINAGKE